MNCCSHAEIRIVRKDDKKMGKEEASTWLWRYNFIIAAEIARVCAIVCTFTAQTPRETS